MGSIDIWVPSKCYMNGFLVNVIISEPRTTTAIVTTLIVLSCIFVYIYMYMCVYMCVCVYIYI